MLQAAMFNGLSFDPFTLFDDGFGPANLRASKNLGE